MRHPLNNHIQWQPNRNPAVAEFDYAIESCRAAASHQNRRIGLLDRLRIGPDLVKVDEITMELGFVFGPDLFHRKDSLAQNPPSLLGVGAVVFHFFGVPSAADPEYEPAIGH